MISVSIECREALTKAIEKELDTRDKRYMFLRMEFPDVLSMIQIEGSPRNTAWNIFSEFDKRGMTGSLIACMNSQLGCNLNLETI